MIENEYSEWIEFQNLSTYPFIYSYVQNEITASPDFMEKVVTTKNYLAMTPVHPLVTISPLGIIPCIMYRLYNLIAIGNWLQQIFITQACTSVLPLILGCTVCCIQLQSSLLLWCMLGCTLTLSAYFMLAYLLLQKTCIWLSIAFNITLLCFFNLSLPKVLLIETLSNPSNFIQGWICFSSWKIIFG